MRIGLEITSDQEITKEKRTAGPGTTSDREIMMTDRETT